MEELFSKPVPVVLKSSDKDERSSVIGVTILLNASTSPVHKKELLVRLTDATDPFFLYMLSLNEVDFQSLKNQQGLLVDFAAFPQKFIELLELCVSEADKETPKFMLQLVVPVGERGVASLLNVVEANPFRHLDHLSLKLAQATDSCLKKYLAECLLSFKEENTGLKEQLTATKTDMCCQLAQCEEVLGARTQELERLKAEWSAHTSALKNEHSAALTNEREKALQAQAEAQRRVDNERRETEQIHSSKVQVLEGRRQELEGLNSELTDHKYQSEASIRELRTKLKAAEEVVVGLQEEVRQLRKDNSALDAGSHGHQKTINHLSTRVAVLEQELLDKEQVFKRTSDLLEVATEHKNSLERELEQTQRQSSKLDTAFKTASQEVMKGNEIIQKLQNELRNVKYKLRSRNMVTTQQEKLLGEKDLAVEKLRNELEALNQSLAQKQEEIHKLEDSLSTTKQSLEESREMLKTNEGVISWLNRQINDQALSRVPGMAGMVHVPAAGTGTGGRLPMADPLSSIRPSPPSARLLTTHYPPNFSSTPTTTTAAASQRQVLGSLASQENKQQVVFRGPAKKSNAGSGSTNATPLVPSPLSSHSLSAHSSHTPLPPNGGIPTSQVPKSTLTPPMPTSTTPTITTMVGTGNVLDAIDGTRKDRNTHHQHSPLGGMKNEELNAKYLQPYSEARPVGLEPNCPQPRAPLVSMAPPPTHDPPTPRHYSAGMEWATNRRVFSGGNSASEAAPLLSAYFPK